MNILNEKGVLAIKNSWYLLVVIFFVVSQNPLHAQALDPSLLQNLQQQQRNGTVERNSPLDAARKTEEEKDIQQARFAARMMAESISFLEKDYQGRIDPKSKEIEEPKKEDNFIRQYGYDVFQSVSLNANAGIGSIPEDYVIGVGDKLVVSFVGANEKSITTQVDREGRLVLQGLPPMNVAGLKFSDLEKQLKAKAAEAMLGTDVYLSVGEVRQIGVFVLGEVSMPGFYNLTSLSSVLQALARAGGVKKSGSLRAIQVEVNGKKQTYDLYSLMLGRDDNQYMLQDGARIIVPTIGKTVAVSGRVPRPAIFELPMGKDEADWSKIIKLAGDTLRPRGNDFAINRIENDGRQTFESLGQYKNKLIAGDLAVVSFKRDSVDGEVFLTGDVQVEGARPLAVTPTLFDLIKGSNALGIEPYLPFAIIETTNSETQARIYKNINLEDVLSGKTNVDLKSRDRVIVLGMDDIKFLSTAALRNVILTGKYEAAKCEALSDMASFVTNFGQDRFAIISRSVFIEETTSKEKKDSQNLKPEQNLNKLNQNQSGRNQFNNNAMENDFSFNQNVGVLSVEDIKDDTQEKDECLVVYEDNKGLLPYVIEHASSVTGAVRTPGLFPISGETGLGALISFAGGFSRTADLSNVEVLRVDSNLTNSSESTTRESIDTNSQSLKSVMIKASYSVRANIKSTDQESGSVLLSGEFIRPGVYTIRKGERLSSLIERAGGITDYAYPLGAVFTRVSAKKAQEDSFRRAAREIDSALAVAAVRTDVTADAIVAAQTLSKELSTVAAAGRVVVEADLSVLRVKPELDTILEPGDKLIIPKRPSHVILGGDLLNPGALQFITGKSVANYIAEAGGLSRSADKDRIYLVYPNGVATPVKLSRWSQEGLPVLPGSAIIVPKNLDSFTTFDRIASLTGIISQLALSAASIAVIGR